MSQRLLSLDAFLKRPRPVWLVEGLLPAAELAVIYGPISCGKSFVALELAGCVTKGRPFAGRPTKQGNVLYLIAEGVAGMRDRLDVLVREDRIDPKRIMIDDSGRQIGNLDERNKLISELEACGFRPDLIIPDTLARHAVGVEENSAKEMGQWTAGVETLASLFGSTVALPHHCGKDGSKGMRGSYALLGAISTSIECSKSGNLITLRYEKQKDADLFAPISFRARKVRHGDIETLVLDHVDGRAESGERLKPDEEVILATLKAAAPHPVKRADFRRADGATIPDSSFDRAANRLIDVGQVRRVGQGEYVLVESPSPNEPQRSPLGTTHPDPISPPSPPPYRVGDVGIRGEHLRASSDREATTTIIKTASNDNCVVIGIPKFSDPTTWLQSASTATLPS